MMPVPEQIAIELAELRATVAANFLFVNKSVDERHRVNQEAFKTITETLEDIRTETKNTNGRVTALETIGKAWRDYVLIAIGAVSGTVAVLKLMGKL